MDVLRSYFFASSIGFRLTQSSNLRDDLLFNKLNESLANLSFCRKLTRLRKQNVATLFLNDSSEFSQNAELSVVPDFVEFLKIKDAWRKYFNENHF